MYTVIRRYEGVLDSAEVIRRAAAEFGPMLAQRPGFQGYWLVDSGGGTLATISVFETQEAAEDSSKAAAGWVAEQMAELVPNPPQITAGATVGLPAETTATA